ncbi:MAG: hypothetical protein AB1898_29455 [Acidobacteriota bacterium]
MKYHVWEFNTLIQVLLLELLLSFSVASGACAAETLAGVKITRYNRVTRTGRVDPAAVTVMRFPGSYGESVAYQDWIYFAPLHGSGFDIPNSILVRRHAVTGEIQTLDLSTIDGRITTCIGVDADGLGNVYTVTRTGGIAIKLHVDDEKFEGSSATVLDLPIQGSYTSVRFFNGFLYIAPMGHGLFLQVSGEEFSKASVKAIDVSTIDAGATGYNGMWVDRKGFLWAAPNWNGKVRTGKVVRIDSNHFTLASASIIDLAVINPEAKGYHGVCGTEEKVVFVNHANETSGSHRNVAVIDINRPSLDGVKIVDIGKHNDKIGGGINCESVGNRIWLFPYMRNTGDGSDGRMEGYGVITVLEPRTLEFVHLDLSDVLPGIKIIPYDGTYARGHMFLSPYKVYDSKISKDDILDDRSISIEVSAP